MASNETVEEIADTVRHLADNLNNGIFLTKGQCNYIADRISAAHKREIAELRECLRLSSNSMEMIVQWLGKYPKWQECLKNGVVRNRKVLEGSAK